MRNTGELTDLIELAFVDESAHLELVLLEDSLSLVAIDELEGVAGAEPLEQTSRERVSRRSGESSALVAVGVSHHQSETDHLAFGEGAIDGGGAAALYLPAVGGHGRRGGLRLFSLGFRLCAGDRTALEGGELDALTRLGTVYPQQGRPPQEEAEGEIDHFDFLVDAGTAGLVSLRLDTDSRVGPHAVGHALARGALPEALVIDVDLGSLWFGIEGYVGRGDTTRKEKAHDDEDDDQFAHSIPLCRIIGGFDVRCKNDFARIRSNPAIRRGAESAPVAADRDRLDLITLFDPIDDIGSLRHLSEDGVFSVEVGLRGVGDEELASIGVGAGVGH